MSYLKLDGKQLSNKIKSELKEEINKLNTTDNGPPGLGIVLVGERPDSKIYVRMKKRACESLGIANYEEALFL